MKIVLLITCVVVHYAARNWNRNLRLAVVARWFAFQLSADPRDGQLPEQILGACLTTAFALPSTSKRYGCNAPAFAMNNATGLEQCLAGEILPLVR